MTHSAGFPPVSAPDARVLILGSLPGGESLRRQQYYANPGNSFWWIMGHLAGAAPELPYDERLRALIAQGIALWDVCASATRPGSLDASIVRGSVVPNDFIGFLTDHANVALIGFNGAAAAKTYARLVLPNLPAHFAALNRAVLPSTSRAYAARRPAQKLEIWRDALHPRGKVESRWAEAHPTFSDIGDAK